MNKTQRSILDAAFEILSQDLSAPLEKIAETAGVTRVTLHRYYNNREALMEATGVELCRLTRKIIEDATNSHDDPRDQLKAVIMQTAEMGDRFHLLMHATEHEDEEHYPKFLEVEQLIADLIETVWREGFIPADIPTAWAIQMYYGVMAVSWRALRDGTVAPKRIPELAWRSFTSGVFATQA